AQGGMWGLITGLAIGITRLSAKIWYDFNPVEGDHNWFQYMFYDCNWLFFCGWMLLFCLVVVFVVSLFTKAPDPAKIQGLVFGTSTPEQRMATFNSWNRWDVIHSVIILGITAAFYIYFW
ncbi:MAG: Na+/glucose cotransporter, partial [Duncaniella sp.]|nr:Na+/glucose cotransporter [Duncaniella sp.]